MIAAQGKAIQLVPEEEDDRPAFSDVRSANSFMAHTLTWAAALVRRKEEEERNQIP